MVTTTGAARALDAETTLTLLARDLSHPPFSAPIEELAALWQVEILRITCERPAALEDHPELSVRVRGAFGRQLHALPPRRTASGGTRPRAWDVLAEPLGQLSPGVEVPKPVVIRAGPSREGLVVELRVLGGAAAWFDEAAGALIAALEAGVALRADGRVRVPLRILDMTEERISGVAWSAGATAARLRFRSPVLARQKNTIVDDPRAIVRGVVRRIDSLARWHATRLVMNRVVAARAIDELSIDTSDLVPYRWQRHSLRQGDTAIPAGGWLGVLGLSGYLGQLAPYLALAATMNTGGQASLGLGWFEMALT